MSRNTLRTLQHGVWRRAGCILLAIILGAGAAPAWPAQTGAGDQKEQQGFQYKAYTEAQIAEALQRPLQLNDCIGIALTKNLSLKQARGNQERARATHSGSFGIFLPVLTVDGTRANNYVDLPDSLGNFFESRFDAQSSVTAAAQLYLPLGTRVEYKRDLLREAQFPQGRRSRSDERAYSFTVTQPLLRGAGPRVASNKVISAGYQRRLQENDFINQQAATVYSVKSAYYNVLQQRQLLQVNFSAFKNDSALAVASEALVIAKLAQRRDVLSAQIRAADSRATLIKSQTDYQSALDALKDEMGMPFEQELPLGPDSLVFKPVSLNEQELLQIALQNNPALRAFQYAIKDARLRRGVSRNATLPQLDLFGTYVRSNETDELANAEVARARGWTAGATLSYNFLSREARGAAQSAQLALIQQEDGYAELEREITLSMREIVRSVFSSAAEVAAIQRGIEVAEQKLEFARAMFNLGRASNFDVTDAQEFLLKAQNQYLRKLVTYYSDLALLETLTGQPVTP